MTTFVPSPTPTRPIIEQDSTMNQEFRTWTQTITNQSTIVGVGSPEGVVEAEITAEYMDSTGAASSVKYIKRDADIAGDKRFGWILI